jgi:hypothetical protein
VEEAAVAAEKSLLICVLITMAVKLTISQKKLKKQNKG